MRLASVDRFAAQGKKCWSAETIIWNPLRGPKANRRLLSMKDTFRREPRSQRGVVQMTEIPTGDLS